jgi:hypothetical protein
MAKVQGVHVVFGDLMGWIYVSVVGVQSYFLLAGVRLADLPAHADAGEDSYLYGSHR